MMTDQIFAGLTHTQSRRAALQTGGALAAALSAFGLRHTVAQEATPDAGMPAAALLLVQGFTSGTLFPTQGDAGGPPYTMYLWEAADRGFLFVDEATRSVGVVRTDPVLTAIMSRNDQTRVALVAPVAGSDDEEPREAVWALRLAFAGAGSDPGSVTYQGDVLAGEEASAWLGGEAEAPSNGALNLGAGFLIIPGLPGLDVAGPGNIHLTLT